MRLRCDRQIPCDTCTRRKLQASCHYASNAKRGNPKASRQISFDDRLQRIEELVSASLINTGAIRQSEGCVAESNWTGPSSLELRTPPESEQLSCDDANSIPAKESPHLQQQNGQAVYMEPSHWMSIMQEIQNIRADLSSQDSLATDDLDVKHNDEILTDINLDVSLSRALSVTDAISSLPPQSTCDILLSNYFNSRYMVPGIVHYGKFRIEYENFWKKPKETTLDWLALLFSILSISSMLGRTPQVKTATGKPMPSPKILQQVTAYCLVSCGYATAKQYALEALLLYLQSQYMTQSQSHAQLWLDLGTVVRLAFRMGYHRDPREMADISIFEGEMRRRVWLYIVQIDALASFHMGLPSMIPTEYCDTEVPRNLYDTDLSIHMDTLPPSRPYTEVTPMLYGIVKSGIMGVFKRIVAHTQSLASPKYDETVALDREMKEVYETIPEVFRRRDVSQSFMDPSDIILLRCTLELLYLKGIVVLHRRYIRHEPENPIFEPSRRFCLEAALEILHRQADLHQATQPGGRLQEEAYVITSLTVHDFLLAAMVVCLDLSIRLEALGEKNEDEFVTRKLHALKVSRQSWAASDNHQAQSRTASLLLNLMIQKVGEMRSQAEWKEAANMSFSAGMELPYIEPVSDMIDGTEAIDWSMLDQFFQNTGSDTM
ncbi:hypothetical protein F1880_003481 [Penicillium rolfsii]|nr:hypothetical protein F1880_003481 [Penicillium rolfsii]